MSSYPHGPALERFWRQVSPEPNTGCWLWLGHLFPGGGGRLAVGSKSQVPAHRWAYQQLVGPLGRLDLLEPTCAGWSCVNPAHRKLTSRQELTVASFLRQVSPEPNSGCWLWTGRLTGSGYGQLHVGGRRMVPAHRWAYEHFAGPVPYRLVCDHLCRERSCVNPRHLEAVSNRENIRRGAKVVTRKREHKLGVQAAGEIRLAYARGEATQAELARRFGCHPQTVARITQGKSYAHPRSAAEKSSVSANGGTS